MRTIRMRKYIFPLGRLIALSVIFIAIVTSAVISVITVLKSDKEPVTENAATDGIATEQSAAEPTITMTEGDADTSPAAVGTPAEPDPPSHEGKCSAKDKLIGLEKSKLPHLRRLAEYQNMCDSFVTDRMMYFTGFPDSDKRAINLANAVAGQIKEFHRHGVSPIVILEPTTETGGYVRLSKIASGQYDRQLDTFFVQLKKAGVTEDMLGIWVPYPEINIPEWDAAGFKPGDFSTIVNGFFGIMRKHYSHAQGSILMNAASFDPSDTDYAHEQYIRFDQYISGIRPGTVQSFGIQGFPYKPPSGDPDRSAMTTDKFLHPELAVQAAESMGVTSVWLNTGSFASMYSGNGKLVSSASERSIVMNDILAEAEKLQDQGFRVMINIFAENKSGTSENIDWSYGNLTNTKNPYRAILFDFISRTADNGIGLSLFNE
ncbi:MAG: hypothetical protein HGA31_04365 [Candidatus Moranbacteria bacterium]|nr:hypothetical protein [Candidatus Moranbacteria bacterium]